jgi:hypothetical protein
MAAPFNDHATRRKAVAEVIHACRASLDARQRETLDELLDHNEFGVALEMLATILDRQEAALDPAVANDAIRLARQMEMPDEARTFQRLSEPHYICPVCGYDGLLEPPWTEDGGGSQEICLSCGIQFGYSDMAGGDQDARVLLHGTWRKSWIAEGCRWRSPSSPPPSWEPKTQLARLHLE